MIHEALYSKVVVKYYKQVANMIIHEMEYMHLPTDELCKTTLGIYYPL